MGYVRNARYQMTAVVSQVLPAAIIQPTVIFRREPNLQTIRVPVCTRTIVIIHYKVMLLLFLRKIISVATGSGRMTRFPVAAL